MEGAESVRLPLNGLPEPMLRAIHFAIENGRVSLEST